MVEARSLWRDGLTPMKVVVWHNPKCATSRKTVELIRGAGHEPVLIDYVKTPPSAKDIATVLKDAGMSARDLLRRRGTPYDELRLGDTAKNEAELIAAMAAHPILIERPVVRSTKGVRLCRPPERVRDIL